MFVHVGAEILEQGDLFCQIGWTPGERVIVLLFVLFNVGQLIASFVQNELRAIVEENTNLNSNSLQNIDLRTDRIVG